MMERINLENYEAFFLDYAEGNLSDDQLIELKSFLDKNPQLKVELESFESIRLGEIPADSYDLKRELIREESTGLARSDYLMIAQVEGEITNEEKEELATLVKENPALLENLAIYHKAVLKENHSLIFKGKQQLLQKEITVVWWRYASVAAAAILFLLFFNVNLSEDVYEPRTFSWKESPVKTEDVSFTSIVTEKLDSGKRKIPKELKVEPTPKEEKLMAQTEGKKVERPSAPSEEVVQPMEIMAEQTTSLPDSIDKKEMLYSETSKNDGKLAALEQNRRLPENSEEYVPIKEVAFNKIKKDVLKGKTFSETVMDELANLTNDKVNFETQKDDKGETQKFAINIGKFSFSKNK